MTLPREELNSLKNTRDFLRMLINSNLGTIRKDARGIREHAGRLLRHYPWDMHLEDMYKKRIKDSI